LDTDDDDVDAIMMPCPSCFGGKSSGRRLSSRQRLLSPFFFSRAFWCHGTFATHATAPAAVTVAVARLSSRGVTELYF
jgi:hypothetical protein